MFCKLNSLIMSRIFFFFQIFILFLLQFNLCIGQQGVWVSQNSGTTSQLLSVSFVDANHGWAIGSRVILHTSDGGSNWSVQDFEINGYTHQFTDVFFIDASTGWIVGSGYAGGNFNNTETLILKTTNGGQDWAPQWMQSGGLLNAVHFVDAQHGWAAGDASIPFTSPDIFYTSNGGTTWQLQPSGISAGTSLVYFKDIFFTNQFTGWAVGWKGGGGGALILQTTNGGSNWTEQNVSYLSELRNVHFIDSQVGWAIGGNGMISTTDGGNTWQVSNNTNLADGNDIYFTDNNNGFIVGMWGNSFYTVDGSVNWGTISTGTTNMLNSCSFVNSNLGWAVGSLGTIIHYRIGPVSINDKALLPGNQLTIKPNPFQNAAKIKFFLNESQHVNLVVFDAHGKELNVICDDYLYSGDHEFILDGSEFINGTYFYRLFIGDNLTTGKLILSR